MGAPAHDLYSLVGARFLGLILGFPFLVRYAVLGYVEITTKTHFRVIYPAYLHQQTARPTPCGFVIHRGLDTPPPLQQKMFEEAAVFDYEDGSFFVRRQFVGLNDHQIGAFFHFQEKQSIHLTKNWRKINEQYRSKKSILH